MEPSIYHMLRNDVSCQYAFLSIWLTACNTDINENDLVHLDGKHAIAITHHKMMKTINLNQISINLKINN
ncbi:hypothetical protein [Providencia manganoxydans]|uniref:hypothetical protein n=1 Tax=Providencia manganoxydans TaxID=2923283 RepID=UPI00280C9E73|nr:hypothetical protein [Providencia stuartii]ELR5081654.1 hypothetical protein [Providencia stuartii]